MGKPEMLQTISATMPQGENTNLCDFPNQTVGELRLDIVSVHVAVHMSVKTVPIRLLVKRWRLKYDLFIFSPRKYKLATDARLEYL
jgi:hypothetical protein